MAASCNIKKIEKLSEQLSKVFEIKSLGNLKYCLEIEFMQNNGGIKMSQKGYIKDIHERYGMLESKSTTDVHTQDMSWQDVRFVENQESKEW